MTPVCDRRRRSGGESVRARLENAVSFQPRRVARGVRLPGWFVRLSRVVPWNGPHSSGRSMYLCEATSVEGFIQQLAVCYVRTGHWFYVSGRVPDGKDPRAVDEKLIARYGIDCSRWERCRRKRGGRASVHYLRLGRSFVLLATHGHHRFFDEEGAGVRDARRCPIRVAGYAVSYRGGHPHVRIEEREYLRMKAAFVELATRRPVERLEAALASLPFEPYAPVRRQLLAIVRAVNRRRGAAGLEPVSPRCLRFLRRIVKPFEVPTGATLGPGIDERSMEAA